MLLGQVPVRKVSMGSRWPCGHAHPELNGLAGRRLSGGPPAPGVCCQATPDGGTVCSDGFIGPAGWPKCPDHNVSGVAEYENIGGALYPKLPTPGMCAGIGGMGAVGIVALVGVLAAVGATGYFLMRK